MREQATALGQKGAAGIGEFDPPARSLEQRYPELLFELADLVAERWLGDVQALGGPAEVELLRDRDEVLHESQV